MSRRVRILIADDHEIIRKGLCQLLLEHYPFAYIEQAAEGRELVDKAVAGRWDVIIADISMPVMSGLEALKIIRQQASDVPVLILSISAEEQYTVGVLKAGASGYLSKDAATAELITAVEQLLQGRRYLPAGLSPEAVSRIESHHYRLPHEQLTEREQQVFQLLGMGLSLTDIARTLSLEVGTVSTYRSRILKKTGLHSHADIIKYMAHNKLD